MSSRSPRIQKKTIFIMGEGSTEEAYLKHLKQNYSQQHQSYIVTVDAGSGGDPLSVVQRANRVTSGKDFNLKFVMVDSDRGISDDFKTFCRKHNFAYIVSTECFSCVLARIARVNFAHPNSGCKRAVKQHMMNQSPTSFKHIQSFFPIETIKALRESEPVVKRTLEIFEQGI